MGVSGGEEGALEGPSMMPGGDREAWDRIAPMLTKMAAQVDGDALLHLSSVREGAGHYVKMVHNGIEYADMQLIAEAYDLMKSVYGLDAPAMADIFQTWKEGDLDSYLIEITAAVLRKTDASTGKPLVDVIVDEAEQKGTGRWTAQNALELGVPLTAITEAVFARVLSANRAMRLELDKKTPAPGRQTRKPEKAEIDAIRDALYASKIVAYAQGLRADVGGLGAVQVGSEARRHGDHLARRMHHPRPLPRSHQGSLRPEPEAREPPARRLFPRGRRQGRRARGGVCCASRSPTACRRRPSLRRSPITTG